MSERPWACVTRVGDVWLKECSPVQAFEVPLTAALAPRWPDRLPPVLAADVERSWLLLGDAGAPIASVEAWESVLPLYAELQQGETERAAAHLAAGVPDLRAEGLPPRYEAWIEREPRLAPFAQRFAELCGSLTRPATVQHDDLAESNVYARDGRIVLIDWGDACIAHPFATMLITLRVVAHFRGAAAARRARAAYLGAWEGDVEEELDRVVPVAAFARALQWERIGDPVGVRRNLDVFLEMIDAT